MILFRRLVVLASFVSLCAWQNASVVSPRGGLVSPQVEKLTPGEVDTGYGYSDASPRQLVRTSTNILYVAVPTCTQYPICPGNAIAMRAGNQVGVPTSFSEKDATRRPQSPTMKDNIGTSAIAIDRNDVIWVAYNTRNYGIHVVPFFSRYNFWGRDVRIGTASAGVATQGKEGIAIAVSGNNVPFVVFTFLGTDKAKHVGLASFTNGGWSAPVQIDDRRLNAGQGALHPTVAFTPLNHLLVAWMSGNENAVYNNPDGIMYVREMTKNLNTIGLPSVEIPDTNFAGNPGYAADTIDQSPSLMVTPDGVAELTYNDTDDAIRFWYASGPYYQTWRGDLQPASQQTHDPAIGPDGHGGLYIYGHGTPSGNRNGVGVNIYRMQLAAGSKTWTPFQLVVTDNDTDCSVSTRWAQFYNYNPQQVDFTYWRDHYPNEQFVTAH